MNQRDKIKLTAAACILIILPMGGCKGGFPEWWGGSTVSDQIEPVVTELETQLDAIQTQLDQTMDDFEAVRANADYMESMGMVEEAAQRRAESDAMIAQIEAGKVLVDQVEAMIEQAEDAVADAGTNGDLVIGIASTAAAIFGVPYVGTIAALLKRRKQMVSLVTNIDDAKEDKSSRKAGDTIVLDSDDLKEANVKSNIHTLIKSIRDANATA